jgi:ATP synthase protein I
MAQLHGEDRAMAREAGRFLGVGVQFAASIVFFLFLGQWLDRRLGTDPWLLLLGVFVGAGAGFYSLYRQLVTVPRQRERGGGE